MQIPPVTPCQMAEIDRRMIEVYHIDLLMMMESAGRILALQAKRLLGASVEGWRILILAGKGNNGGGGLASARYLHKWGADVEVVLSAPRTDLKRAPVQQLEMLQRLDVPIEESGEIGDFEMIIDALLGYNQRGDPRGKIAELIEEANSAEKLVIALDIPSGLDPTTGKPNQPCIKATQTLTLALPKTGLLEASARDYVGDLFLADIGVPAELYLEFTKTKKPIFADDGILRIEV